MIPTKPGIYPSSAVSMEEYLATPAVSASIIKAAVERCPNAAFYQSWLNPNRPRPNSDATDASDLGEICHGIILEGSTSRIVALDPSDYPNEKGGGFASGFTNKAIRAARDTARAEGKIPILASNMKEVTTIVDAVSRYIASLSGSRDELAQKISEAFKPSAGESETTILWNEGQTLCRIRPDRLSVDLRLVVDLKFTGVTAEPNTWSRRQMSQMGYATSAAFYRRGLRATYGREFDYVFLVVENTAPYLCSLVGVDPGWLALGNGNVQEGLAAWASCRSVNFFPGYPQAVVYPEVPPYLLKEWETQ